MPVRIGRNPPGPGGSIQCRVNVDAITTNDDPNCRPLNLFGFGAPLATPDALRYVLYTSSREQWAEQINAPADGAVLVRIRKVTDPNGLGLTQNLEDALWRELRPMFGKLGGK